MVNLMGGNMVVACGYHIWGAPLLLQFQWLNFKWWKDGANARCPTPDQQCLQRENAPDEGSEVGEIGEMRTVYLKDGWLSDA